MEDQNAQFQPTSGTSPTATPQPMTTSPSSTPTPVPTAPSPIAPPTPSAPAQPVAPSAAPATAPIPAAGQSLAPVTTTQQVGKYKVEVIRDKCISAASCVAIAPKTFKLDEEQIAEVISQAGDDDATKLLGAQSCPTAAIVVTDTTTGEQVWPK